MLNTATATESIPRAVDEPDAMTGGHVHFQEFLVPKHEPETKLVAPVGVPEHAAFSHEVSVNELPEHVYLEPTPPLTIHSLSAYVTDPSCWLQVASP